MLFTHHYGDIWKHILETSKTDVSETQYFVEYCILVSVLF